MRARLFLSAVLRFEATADVLNGPVTSRVSGVLEELSNDLAPDVGIVLQLGLYKRRDGVLIDEEMVHGPAVGGGGTVGYAHLAANQQPAPGLLRRHLFARKHVGMARDQSLQRGLVVVPGHFERRRVAVLVEPPDALSRHGVAACSPQSSITAWTVARGLWSDTVEIESLEYTHEPGIVGPLVAYPARSDGGQVAGGVRATVIEAIRG